MRKKRILATLLTGFMASSTMLSMTGCNLIQKSSSISSSSEQTVGGYTHPDFVTQYTPGEHVRRIEERTKQRFASELASGVIKDFTVEIIYAFYDDDPEYFMVQLEYRKEWKGAYTCKDYTNSAFYGERIDYTTKYKYTIGYIQNDTYWFKGFAYYSKGFKEGRNPYVVSGYENAKKYYGGGVHAVDQNGKRLTVLDLEVRVGGNAPEFTTYIAEAWEQRFLTEKEEKRLMISNYKLLEEIY